MAATCSYHGAALPLQGGAFYSDSSPFRRKRGHALPGRPALPCLPRGAFLPALPSPHRNLRPQCQPSSSAAAAAAWPGATLPPARRRQVAAAARKRMFDDPFNYGDDPDLEYGELMADGKQAPDPRLPSDPKSREGFLSFPVGYNPEIASLGIYIRGDVRCMCVLAAGGVYENLLLLPVLQLLKNKYPGVEIDVVAGARGKQVYELCKNVRKAWVYELEDPSVPPAESTEFLGLIKNEHYDLLLSTRMAGIGHAMFLFLSDARQRVGYVYPNVNGAGAARFFSHAIRPQRPTLAEGGYHMYSELADFLRKETKFAGAEAMPPLEIGIPRAVRAAARERLGAAPGGSYTLVHGVESASAAAMRAQGDPDSALPLAALAKLVEAIEGDVIVAIPTDDVRARLSAALGPGAKLVKVATPGQLAAIVSDAARVVTTNTSALPMGLALSKPTVALFGSKEKAALFVPEAMAQNCRIVASQTGKLADLDIGAMVGAVADSRPALPENAEQEPLELVQEKEPETIPAVL